MKRKDALYLGLAIAIMAVAGLLLLGGSRKSTGPVVEIVPEVEPQYDKAILAELTNENAHRNFAVKVNLKTELGNTRPFGR